MIKKHKIKLYNKKKSTIMSKAKTIEEIRQELEDAKIAIVEKARAEIDAILEKYRLSAGVKIDVGGVSTVINAFLEQNVRVINVPYILWSKEE